MFKTARKLLAPSPEVQSERSSSTPTPESYSPRNSSVGTMRSLPGTGMNIISSSSRHHISNPSLASSSSSPSINSRPTTASQRPQSRATSNAGSSTSSRPRPPSPVSMYHSADMGFGPVKPPKVRPLPPPPPGKGPKHTRSASTIPGTVLPPPMFSIKPLSLRGKNKSNVPQEGPRPGQYISPKPSSIGSSHVSHTSISSSTFEVDREESVQTSRQYPQALSSKIARVMGDNAPALTVKSPPEPENQVVAGPSRPPKISLDTSSLHSDIDNQSRAESPMMFSCPHTVPAFVSRWAVRELDEDRREQESIDQNTEFNHSEAAVAQDNSDSSSTVENDDDKVQPKPISPIRRLPTPPGAPTSRPLPKISSIPSLLQSRIDEEEDDDDELESSRPPSPLIITSPMHASSRPRTPLSTLTRSPSPTLYESRSSKEESKRQARRRSYTTMEFLPEFSSVPPSPVFHNFVEVDVESQSESSSSPPESAVMRTQQQFRTTTGVERPESPSSVKDAPFHQYHLSTRLASLTLPKRSRSFNLLSSGASRERYHHEISSRPMPKPPVATAPQMDGATGGWSGEWNSDDIQDVIHRLRKLK